MSTDTTGPKCIKVRVSQHDLHALAILGGAAFAGWNVGTEDMRENAPQSESDGNILGHVASAFAAELESLRRVDAALAATPVAAAAGFCYVDPDTLDALAVLSGATGLELVRIIARRQAAVLGLLGAQVFPLDPFAHRAACARRVNRVLSDPEESGDESAEFARATSAALIAEGLVEAERAAERGHVEGVVRAARALAEAALDGEQARATKGSLRGTLARSVSPAIVDIALKAFSAARMDVAVVDDPAPASKKNEAA